MDLKRANEITKSVGYNDVIYNNKHVWIESINNKTSTAHIKDINSDEEYQVSVDKLHEENIKEF